MNKNKIEPARAAIENVTIPHASVAQCIRANQAFAYALRLYASCPDESREAIINNAIAYVWTAGRLYQKSESVTANKTDAIRLYDSIVRGGAGL